MLIPLPKARRLSVPLVAALVVLAGCSDGPTAPDPLDAESLANRLEVLSRIAPGADGVMLGAASIHFRDAGRVTPIAVIVDGRSETWYAASSETVWPPLPCPAPGTGLICGDVDALEIRHLVAVDGVNATRLLAITTMTDGSGSFDQRELEWPIRAATGFLLVPGSGVQAFASSGNATSSITETLGACPEPMRRGPPAQRIASCERVSIAWQVEAEMTSLRGGDAAPSTTDIVIPAIDVSGARLVLSTPVFPGS